MSRSVLAAPACGICFNEYNNERLPAVLSCGHSWCIECVGRISLRQCPLCRQAFDSHIIRNYALEEYAQKINEELTRQRQEAQRLADLELQNRDLQETLQRGLTERKLLLTKMSEIEKVLMDMAVETEVGKILTDLRAERHPSERSRLDAAHRKAREMLNELDKIDGILESRGCNRSEMQQLRKDYLEQLQDRAHVKINDSPVKLSAREMKKLWPYFSRMSYRELLLYTELDVMSEEKLFKLQKFCQEISASANSKKRFMNNVSSV